MPQLRVWWRSYLPLDLIADPNQRARKARYEAGRVHTFWGYPPVPGSLHTSWHYVACTPEAGRPKRKPPDPLVEPVHRAEQDDDDTAMPQWATHLMLLIEAEVMT